MVRAFPHGHLYQPAVALPRGASLSGALKLKPANLGIKEAVFVAISGIYGTGINEGLHAAALHRIIGTVCTLLLAPGFVYPLPKK